MAELSGAGGPVTGRVSQAARRLTEEFGSGSGSPLAAVAAARELAAAANSALQAAVDRARGTGHSWREIGDVLDTTRQAAFQRFGHPIDPRTGTPMSRETLPGATDRALTLFLDMAAGHWEQARRDFGEKMREGLGTERLAEVWATVVGMIGAFDRAGEPVAYPAPRGTVVDVPLYFEAGERAGRVSYDHDGRVIGLFFRSAAT